VGWPDADDFVKGNIVNQDLSAMPLRDLLTKMSIAAHVADHGGTAEATSAELRLTEYCREYLRRQELKSDRAGQGI